ncbi:MAG: phosphomannomutase/phosphoglucomutase, partial [Armatimonadetes bacterium]|nr:phosphomannomutase/phosphoglucomutase [Armatimonadota bacterium]
MKLDPNIFRAYDIRGTVGENITPEVVRTITHGFGTLLVRDGRDTVVLGRDLRPSSEELAAAAAEGLQAAGCEVLDLGEVPIPLVYFAAGRWSCGGGVGITASHKPVQFNGLKLRWGDQPYYGRQLQQLRELCDAGDFAHGNGSCASRDIFDEYFEVVTAKFSGDTGLHIVLDLGNGCGVFTTRRLLEATGARVDVMFDEPDGTFPNRPPDPLEHGALEKLSERVVHSGADIG